MNGRQRLAERVALITGAAQGQGAAEARRFVAEGARVVLGDVQPAPVLALARELGERAVALPMDVTRGADWDEAVGLAQDDFGALHILVNNAGIGSGPSGPLPIASLPPEEWRAVVETNLTSVFLGIQHATPLLQQSVEQLRRDSPEATGSIINVSSAQAFLPSRHNAAYAASKWGQRGLTRVAALELAPLIRVNAVMPGPIETPMIASMLESGGRVLQGLVDSVPLGRVGQADEVAAFVCFLASEESGYCTGGEYPIEGGRLAGG